MSKLMDLNDAQELRTQIYNVDTHPADTKSYYNLGYFDSIVENDDNTVTITRQTGYVRPFGTWLTDSMSGGFYRYFLYIPNTDLPFSGSEAQISEDDLVANCPIGSYSPVFGGSVKAGIIIAKDNNYYLGYISSTEMTSDQINDLKLVIQYRRNTSYTEKALKNLPINGDIFFDSGTQDTGAISTGDHVLFTKQVYEPGLYLINAFLSCQNSTGDCQLLSVKTTYHGAKETRTTNLNGGGTNCTLIAWMNAGEIATVSTYNYSSSSLHYYYEVQIVKLK